MKELRELISDPVVSAFLDILPHHDTVAVICTGLGERRFTTSQLAPLIAMHNALPELLGAWETLEALRWAQKISRAYTDHVLRGGEENPCKACPMKYKCGRGVPTICRYAVNHEFEWLKAWRDAHADTKAD